MEALRHLHLQRSGQVTSYGAKLADELDQSYTWLMYVPGGSDAADKEAVVCTDGCFASITACQPWPCKILASGIMSWECRVVSLQRNSMEDQSRPRQFDIDAKMDKLIDLSLRRVVYGSLAAGLTSLVLFSELHMRLNSFGKHELVPSALWRSQPLLLSDTADWLPLKYVLGN